MQAHAAAAADALSMSLEWNEQELFARQNVYVETEVKQARCDVFAVQFPLRFQLLNFSSLSARSKTSRLVPEADWE